MNKNSNAKPIHQHELQNDVQACANSNPRLSSALYKLPCRKNSFCYITCYNKKY